MKFSTVFAAVNAYEVARDRRQAPEERAFDQLEAIMKHYNGQVSKFKYSEYGKLDKRLDISSVCSSVYDKVQFDHTI